MRRWFAEPPASPEDERAQLDAAIAASLVSDDDTREATAPVQPETAPAVDDLTIRVQALTVEVVRGSAQARAAGARGVGSRPPPGAAQERVIPVCPIPQVPGQRLQYYAVWDVVGKPELRGIWVGPYPRCWQRLCSQLPGGRYGPSCRLRGATSFDDVVRLYESEAPRRGLPLPPPIHCVP